MEFDLDKALEDVPVHLEDSAPQATATAGHPRQEKRPSGAMGELPSEEGKKLQHYTKLRPRRNKKLPPSKVPVSGPGERACGSLSCCWWWCILWCSNESTFLIIIIIIIVII